MPVLSGVEHCQRCDVRGSRRRALSTVRGARREAMCRSAHVKCSDPVSGRIDHHGDVRNPTHLDFTTRVSAMCECVLVTGSLGELSERADAVLHVRLSDSELVPSTIQGYYRHSAAVVSAVKQPAGPRAGTIFVLQNQGSGAPAPYDVGQEMVAFLESSGSDAFRITNDNNATSGIDRSLVFLVQDGRIRRAPSEFSRYVGMPIASFLQELRTISRHAAVPFDLTPSSFSTMWAVVHKRRPNPRPRSAAPPP
jgi:hypothetical protein